MPSPRLSRTVKSLLEKRGAAKRKAAESPAPSDNAVVSPSTPTTTTSIVETGAPETANAAMFSASGTLSVIKNPTSKSSVPSRSLADYDLGSPNQIAATLPEDLQVRIEKLRQYWGADSADTVVDHIILVCLHSQGDWREKRVDLLVRTWLDAVGLV